MDSLAGHYKLTGMHSHRHPFYGFDGPGDVIDLDSPFAVEEALSAVEAESKPASLNKFVRPAIDGLTTGVASYAVMRGFDVMPKKAMRAAFVLGSLGLLVGLAQDWLFREVKAVQAAQLKVAAK